MGQQAVRQNTRQDRVSSNSIILFINLPALELEILIGCINVTLISILLEIEISCHMKM
jgi:hypothetical protein